MKPIHKLLIVLFILTAVFALFPAPVQAQGPGGDDSPIIFGDNFTLRSGETVQNLVVFGGNVSIQEGATVREDILIFGGNLGVAGTVNGDITTFGGNVTLTETAVVTGMLNSIGGNRVIAPGAKYGGITSNFTRLPFRMPSVAIAPHFGIDLGPGFSILSAVFLSLTLAVMAVLVALFLPHPTERVAQTIATEPVISGGVGLLTLVVAPVIILVLGITIILIPLALLFALAFGITIIFGWIALGLELGKRLAGMVHAFWPTPVSAGIGTLLLSLVSNLLLALTGSWVLALCCIGVPMMILLTILGLGAAISSRFGTQVPVQRPSIPPFPPPVVPMAPPAAWDAGQPIPQPPSPTLPPEPAAPPTQPGAEEK